MEIEGDILDVPQKEDNYIVQQCNCLSVRAHGLSEDIAKKYSYANVYSYRKGEGSRNLAIAGDRAVPGTYKLYGRASSPTIVALFAQYDMGQCGKYYGQRPKDYDDTPINRLAWFKQSIESFGDHLLATNTGERAQVYLPYKIGCGLAGGSWNKYLKVIQDFAERIRSCANVYIIKLKT